MKGGHGVNLPPQPVEKDCAPWVCGKTQAERGPGGGLPVPLIRGGVGAGAPEKTVTQKAPLCKV